MTTMSWAEKRAQFLEIVKNLILSKLTKSKQRLELDAS